MNEIKLVVCFEGEGRPGFTTNRGYEVIAIDGRQFLLIDNDATPRWVDPASTVAVSAIRQTDVLFDLSTHRARRRLEAMEGKSVRFTTWEHIGFDPDEMTDENMYVYRGVVEEYDGQTLFLRRLGADSGRFGILPKAIATLDEA